MRSFLLIVKINKFLFNTFLSIFTVPKSSFFCHLCLIHKVSILMILTIMNFLLSKKKLFDNRFEHFKIFSSLEKYLMKNLVLHKSLLIVFCIAVFYNFLTFLPIWLFLFLNSGVLNLFFSAF